MCYKNLRCAAAVEKYRPTGNVHMQQSGLLEFSLGLGYIFPSSSDLFFYTMTDAFVYFINEDKYINREDTTTRPCAFFVCAYWE